MTLTFTTTNLTCTVCANVFEALSFGSDPLTARKVDGGEVCEHCIVRVVLRAECGQRVETGSGPILVLNHRDNVDGWGHGRDGLPDH